MIAAYCARAWRLSTWCAVGTRPITCPPLDAETVDIRRLHAPIVYLRLHGVKDQPYLYGDPGWTTALSAEQVEQADFSGSIVFLEGCFGLELGDAFMKAGALAVVGSTVATMGRRWRLGPSSIIGREWLRQMKRGATVSAALGLAVRRVGSPHNFGWAAIGHKNARIQK